MPLPPTGIPTPPYLDDAAVRRLLKLDALLPAMRQALIDLSAGRVLQPLRSVLELAEEVARLKAELALLRTRETSGSGASEPTDERPPHY